MSTINTDFVHKRELLLAKYDVVRELSLLAKNLLSQQQFEAATAIAERLDSNVGEFAKQLEDLQCFDKQVVIPVATEKPLIVNCAVPPEQTPFEAISIAAIETEAPAV